MSLYEDLSALPPVMTVDDVLKVIVHDLETGTFNIDNEYGLHAALMQKYGRPSSSDLSSCLSVICKVWSETNECSAQDFVKASKDNAIETTRPTVRRRLRPI